MSQFLKLFLASITAFAILHFFSILVKNPAGEPPVTTMPERVNQNEKSATAKATPSPSPTTPPPAKASKSKENPTVEKSQAAPAPTAERSEPARPTPEPTPPPPPALSDQELYSRYSGAVVQIFCVTAKEIFSASGIIVNGGGLVLTNAHVADVVEKAGEDKCQARHGNPASSFAKVKIIFKADTKLKISETQVPQRDIAFLKIYDAAESFSVAEISLSLANAGEGLLTLGYPSEFLQSLNTANNSNLVFSLLAVASLADIDGDSNTAEGYVFNGGLALQQGSSGTALFNRGGKVVGLLFATTKNKTTAEREGIGFMMPYVDKVIRLETGQSLAEFISSH